MYAFTGIGGHIWPFENDIVGHAASVYLSSNWLEKIDGERIYDHDVIVTDTSTGQTSVFFEGYNYLDQLGGDIDVNNFDLLNDGSFVFSPHRDMTVSGTAYQRGDIVRFDPSSGSSTLYFRGNSVLSENSIIDALAMRSDGSFIFSTAYDNGSIGGVAFDRSDIVDYNPFTGVASIYLTRDQIFDANNSENNLVNIGALDFLPNGNIILNVGNDSSYFIGGVEYDADDLIEFNPLTYSANLFLDGETIFGQRYYDEDVMP